MKRIQLLATILTVAFACNPAAAATLVFFLQDDAPATEPAADPGVASPSDIKVKPPAPMPTEDEAAAAAGDASAPEAAVPAGEWVIPATNFPCTPTFSYSPVVSSCPPPACQPTCQPTCKPQKRCRLFGR
jgi:hypothetical protein